MEDTKKPFGRAADDEAYQTFKHYTRLSSLSFCWWILCSISCCVPAKARFASPVISWMTLTFPAWNSGSSRAPKALKAARVASSPWRPHVAKNYCF